MRFVDKSVAETEDGVHFKNVRGYMLLKEGEVLCYANGNIVVYENKDDCDYDHDLFGVEGLEIFSNFKSDNNEE